MDCGLYRRTAELKTGTIVSADQFQLYNFIQLRGYPAFENTWMLNPGQVKVANFNE